MLKCGQKDNKHYTFGVRKEQMIEDDILIPIPKTVVCKKCGKSHEQSGEYCPFCGEKL